MKAKMGKFNPSGPFVSVRSLKTGALTSVGVGLWSGLVAGVGFEMPTYLGGGSDFWPIHFLAVLALLAIVAKMLQSEGRFLEKVARRNIWVYDTVFISGLLVVSSTAFLISSGGDFVHSWIYARTLLVFFGILLGMTSLFGISYATFGTGMAVLLALSYSPMNIGSTYVRFFLAPHSAVWAGWLALITYGMGLVMYALLKRIHPYKVG